MISQDRRDCFIAPDPAGLLAMTGVSMRFVRLFRTDTEEDETRLLPAGRQ